MSRICLFVLFVSVGLFTAVAGDSQNLTQSAPCTDENHVLLTPGVVTSDAPNRACVSRFHTAGPALLRLTVAADGNSTTVTRVLPPGDGGCIDFAVPLVTNPQVDLLVNIRYPAAGCAWARGARARARGARLLLLRGERARYRGGEVVRLRVFALRGGAPAPGAIDEVWLEAPAGAAGAAAGAGAAGAGARVAEWLRVRTRLGVAQLTHALEPRAPHGRWTARARTADGSQGSTEFWVGDYELPPFRLSVQHAPRVLQSAERLSWNVCVRYPWGESVEGVLLVRLRGPGGAGVRTAAALRAARACHRHAVAAARLGLGGGEAGGGGGGGEGGGEGVVIADFSFQEKGTNVWQNTTVVSRVVQTRVDLEFLSRHRTLVAPGLPYKLKVKATRWDGKPSGNETLSVCRRPVNGTVPDRREHGDPVTSRDGDGTCDDAVTDATGVARFVFTVHEDEEYPFYRFEAFVKNDSRLRARPLTLPVRRAGPSAAFGALAGGRGPGARALAPLYLRLGEPAAPLTVHFVVITRGGNIHRWGATTQCPQAADGQPRTATLGADCTNLHRFTYKTDQSHLNNIQLEPKQSRQLGYHPKVNYHLNARIYEDKMAGESDKMADESNKMAAESDKNGGMNASTTEESKLLRVMIPIRMSHQMCPDSHLIAYFYHNGELVSASKHFDYDECFANKVRLSWLSGRVSPGARASLRLATPGPAVCALTALDAAAAAAPAAAAIREALVDALRRHMSDSRNATLFDVMGYCYMEQQHLPRSPMEQLAASLAEAGVRAAADGAARRGCAAPALLAAPAPPPLDERSRFEEAWLWRLAVVTNGTATVSAPAPHAVTRYEAAAVCLSRRGLAVSPPAVLQVFREFFIHADGPRRLRRGDSAVVQLRIFNYLYQPLAIEVQILTDARLQLLTAVTESLCVAARASVARRVLTRARAPGRARLSVRAATRPDGCGNETAAGGAAVSDEVIIPVEIEYEGIPQEEHRSILLCGQDAADSAVSSVSWRWAAAAPVPGSEGVRLGLAGDLNAPLFQNFDDLVQLPLGCGEQNLARLATSLLALTHADPLSSVALTAKDHVARGLARQLQFLHPGGGFSAFGPSDGQPSTWLTAFAVRYLKTAYKTLGSPPPDFLAATERWLLETHMENGCFRNQGQVFHREMKGGLGEPGSAASVALAAYVVTSLLDGDVTPPPRLLQNSLVCLRALSSVKKASNRVYAHALVTHATMRLRRLEDELRGTNDVWLRDPGAQGPAGPPPARDPGLLPDKAPQQLARLLKMAKRSGDLLWLETDSLPTSIEATGYLLLSLSLCVSGAARGGAVRDGAVRDGCGADGRAVRRWLDTHRSGRGGFVSTQDTLIALEALAAWSSVQPAAPVHLNVTTACGAAVNTRSLTPASARVPLVIDMETCEKLNVEVKGAGCVLVQATRSYNVDVTAAAPGAPSGPAPAAPAPAPARALTLQVAVSTDGPVQCDADGAFCSCAAVIEACVSWRGGFPEMALLELSLPGGARAAPAPLYPLVATDAFLRRVETSQNGGKVSLYLGSRDGGNMAGASGHVCYRLPAVGAPARTAPAHARVVDYYNTAVNDSQIYTIPESCPPRLSRDRENYNKSDNLFGSARSANDGEILMDYEFSYENMPEGIPLDDPYYYSPSDADERLGKNGDVDYLNSENDANEADSISNDDIHDLDIENTTNDANYELNAFSPTDNKDERDNSANGTGTTNSEFNSTFRPIDLMDEIGNGNEVIDSKEPTKSDMKEVTVDNPKLSNFHVIDDEKDLEVPEGVEGPAAAVALPPDYFVAPSNSGDARRYNNITLPRQSPFYIYPYKEEMVLG